ncbi:MAG: hypothetical protein IJ605_04505 [Prevotella sp.]|nr:hypothetical protein [Prevotella sp.]
MNKNSFNIRRFWQLLCQHFTDNAKTVGYVVGGTLLACIVVILFNALFGSVPAYAKKFPFEASTDILLGTEAVKYASWVIFIVKHVFVSYVFVNISLRSNEIRYLTLPATNGEKWLSRVVYVLVVAVMIQLAYYVSVMICAGIGQLFHVEALTALTQLEDFYKNSNEAAMTMSQQGVFSVFSYVATAFLLAAYLLGGTIHRNVPWLSTTIVLFGTFLATIFAIGPAFVKYVNEHHPEFVKLMSERDLSWFYSKLELYLPYVSAGFFVLTVAMIWLSYRVFCRRQLVRQKMKLISK